MHNIKHFFNLVKFEFVKLFRNKLLFVFIIAFPILMTFVVNSINFDNNKNLVSNNEQQEQQNDSESKVIALYANGELAQGSELSQILNSFYSSNRIQVVQSFAQGEQLLKEWAVYFFVFIDTTATPNTAVFYYDSSSNAGNLLAGELRKKQLQQTYTSLINFLAGYGIVVNESYFNVVQFETIATQHIGFAKRIMPLTASFIAAIIMFGLAYSVARDNETNVVKQISYTPISVNKYLLSKALPFFIIGLLQAGLLLLMGAVVYGVNYQANLLLIAGCYALFVVSSIGLGLLFSTINNQTTTTFATLIAILLPVMATFIAFVNSYPLWARVLIYCFPLSSYIQLLSQQSYSGVTLPFFVILLACQAVGYYVLAYYLSKAKAGK